MSFNFVVSTDAFFAGESYSAPVRGGGAGMIAAEKRTPSPENPSFSLQDPDAWDMFFGGAESDSGVKVNHAKAPRYSPVWQAVSLISGDVARLPLYPYRYADAAGKDRSVDTKHPAYMLVRRRANREASAFRFWRRVLVHLLIYNNAYVFIDRDRRGRPLELLNLLPDRTGPKRIKRELWYFTEVNGKSEPIRAANVLHFQGVSSDCLAGLDLVKHAKNAIGLGLAAEGFASKFFKHGAKHGGILEVPAGMSKPARDKIERDTRDFHEGENNWFKTLVLRENAKWHSVSIPPNEGQMLETREQQVREVARYYNLSPSRLGVRDGGGYNSLFADNQSYLDNTLAPWLEEITSECWMKLLSPEEQQGETHYFEHNTNKLLTMSPLERHQIYAIGIRNSMYSPNECRRKENENGREGGDAYVPLPKGPTGGSSDGGVDKQPADGGSTKKGAVDDDGNTDPPELKSRWPLAVRRALFAIARQARHKAKNPRAFVEWIDGGLVQFRAELLSCFDAREASAGEAEFAAILAGLRRIVDTVTAEELPAAVEQFAATLEM